jgi:hypothetical protein
VTTDLCRDKCLGPVHDLAEFIRIITDSVDELVDTDDPRVVFRGQRDENHQLLPGIAREHTFPLSSATESSMLSEFKRRSLPYLTLPTAGFSEIDWLAIAQHHGMATRLLDWSGNALAALWFAVKGPPKEDTNGVVWMLTYGVESMMSKVEHSPFQSRHTSVFHARHISPRITAQDGCFTLHQSYDDVNDTIRFEPLDAEDRYADKLRYVTIPPDAFGRMRLDLAKAGVTPVTLFPDLDGLAAFVNGSHLYQEDERELRLVPAPGNRMR